MSWTVKYRRTRRLLTRVVALPAEFPGHALTQFHERFDPDYTLAVEDIFRTPVS